MPILEKILEQWAVIQAAWIPFVIVNAAVALLIWAAVNWRYRSVLASKNAQIELLVRQVADWKQKAEGAPDQATSRIDNLEARIGRVEHRRLSIEQRNIIGAHVGMPQGPAYSLSILSDMSCTDCNQYAIDFQAILTDAHWTIAMPKVEKASAASPKGIAILTPDTSKPLPEAAALVRALKAAEIPFDLKTGALAALLITARSG